MVTIEYRCDDGTPFPVTFASEEDAAREWRLEQEHSRGPGSPLARSVGLAGLGQPGGERAYAEAGLPMPGQWRPGPDAHGFPYFVADSLPSGEEMAALVKGCSVLVEEHGSAWGVWEQFSLPRVEAACRWLQAAPAGTPIAPLAERADYAQHHTMVSSMITWNDIGLIQGVLQDLFGPDTHLVATELTQGFANETLRANERLWEVAAMARDDAELAAALGSARPAEAMASLRAAGRHDAFFTAIDAFLDRYGWRGEMWSIDSPTWLEQGDGFWNQVRHLAREDATSPEDTRARAAERRAALIADIDARLAGREEQQARFRRRVERLASYVPVREDRALWQLIAVGSLRQAVLRRGEQLAERGVIDRAGDVLYLAAEEFDAGEGEYQGIVAERRAEHERWRAVRPPAAIGGATPASVAPTAAGPLRGIGASRGRVTARARVVLELADADRLEPGDVLVCTMTSPPWTPLFAVAAAVVTDSGSMESHPAIAAREYGLPCVVGTGSATVAIPDGAEVTVDGGAGTVELTGPAR